MFCYCGNNPVMLFDPSGKVSTFNRMMTDSGGLSNPIIEVEKESALDIKKDIALIFAFFRGFEWEIGLGTGIGGSVEWGITEYVSIGASLLGKKDLINFSHDNGKLFFGTREETNIGCNLSVLEYNNSEIYEHSFFNKCQCRWPYFDYECSSLKKIKEDGLDINKELGSSVKLYYGFGVTVDLRYDVGYFLSEWVRISDS